ncbi:unnamed protein product [Citrullus colocynthis]|uniref:Uncharacterized protein n=1 Tax=Citrullus colocynthis TaxID=252529 RepID=A0ABP0YBK4_9ROSI
MAKLQSPPQLVHNYQLFVCDVNANWLHVRHPLPITPIKSFHQVRVLSSQELHLVFAALVLFGDLTKLPPLDSVHHCSLLVKPARTSQLRFNLVLHPCSYPWNPSESSSLVKLMPISHDYAVVIQFSLIALSVPATFITQ